VVAGAAVGLAIVLGSVSSAMAKTVAAPHGHTPVAVVHTSPAPPAAAAHTPAPPPPPVVAVHTTPPPPPVVAVHTTPPPPPVVAVHTTPPVVALKVPLPVAHAAGHKIA
jgi:hypothetical protein